LTGSGICFAATGRIGMPDEPPAASAGRELTAEIVAAFVRHNQIASDQVAPLIATVHRALTALSKESAEPTGGEVPAVPIRRSVTANSVVCLNCG
jgi:predicted transcriptional regulator